MDLDYAVFSLMAPMMFLIMMKHSLGACVPQRLPAGSGALHRRPDRNAAVRPVRAAAMNRREGPRNEPTPLERAGDRPGAAAGRRQRAARPVGAQDPAGSGGACRHREGHARWWSWPPPTWSGPKPRELAQGLPISGSLKAVNSALVKARAAGELQDLTRARGRRRQGRPGDRPHRRERIRRAPAAGAAAGRRRPGPDRHRPAPVGQQQGAGGPGLHLHAPRWTPR